MVSSNLYHSGQRDEHKYDKKLCGALPIVEDSRLVNTVDLKSKQKLANKWPI